MPHAITTKRLTITPVAATKKLDITPISHSDTTCTLHIMRKRRLNVPQKRKVPNNYGGNLNEAKQADLDVKIGSDFSIGSHNNLLQQIGNSVAALEYVRNA
jgi:hypothetical protein